MKVSIVTITRNNAAGLARTLRSVASQRGVDVEHIVVDGLSTDGTAKLLENRAVRVVPAAQRGVYNAINRGIEEATGHIVGLLHAGDVFADDGVLADVCRCFEQEVCDYMYGNIYYVNEAGKVTRRYDGASSSLNELTYCNMPPHPSLYMTRKCAAHIGPYAENYKICGDFDMFIRLFADTSLEGCYVDRDIVAMSTGGMSTKLFNRLFTNPRERLAVLRANRLPANPLRMLPRYIKILINML